jgi:hypothetical protein
MNEAEIKAIVDKLADVARVLHEADPADKAEVFRQLTSHQADGSSKRPSSLCGMSFSTVSEVRLHQIANVSWLRSSPLAELSPAPSPGPTQADLQRADARTPNRRGST